MDIIYSRFFPSRLGYINLGGILIAGQNPYYTFSKQRINRELIRTLQIKELGYIFYYIIYVFQVISNFLKYQDLEVSKRLTSSELELYLHQCDDNYLTTRKKYNEFRYDK